MTLKQIARAIQANVESLNGGLVTTEQFSTKQRRLWDAVAKGEQNIIGSPCSRRHSVVLRELGFKS